MCHLYFILLFTAHSVFFDIQISILTTVQGYCFSSKVWLCGIIKINALLTLIHLDVTYTKDSSVQSSDSYILSYLVTGIRRSCVTIFFIW